MLHIQTWLHWEMEGGFGGGGGGAEAGETCWPQSGRVIQVSNICRTGANQGEFGW